MASNLRNLKQKLARKKSSTDLSDASNNACNNANENANNSNSNSLSRKLSKTDYKKKAEQEKIKRVELKNNYQQFIEAIKKSPCFCTTFQEWSNRSRLGAALSVTCSTYSDGSLNFKLYRKNKNMLYFLVSPIDFNKYNDPKKPYTITTTIDEHGKLDKNYVADDLEAVFIDDNFIPRHKDSPAFGTSINSQDVMSLYNTSPSPISQLSQTHSGSKTPEIFTPELPSLSKTLSFSRKPTEPIAEYIEKQNSASMSDKRISPALVKKQSPVPMEFLDPPILIGKTKSMDKYKEKIKDNDKNKKVNKPEKTIIFSIAQRPKSPKDRKKQAEAGSLSALGSLSSLGSLSIKGSLSMNSECSEMETQNDSQSIQPMEGIKKKEGHKKYDIKNKQDDKKKKGSKKKSEGKSDGKRKSGDKSNYEDNSKYGVNRKSLKRKASEIEDHAQDQSQDQSQDQRDEDSIKRKSKKRK